MNNFNFYYCCIIKSNYKNIQFNKEQKGTPLIQEKWRYTHFGIKKRLIHRINVNLRNIY